MIHRKRKTDSNQVAISRALRCAGYHITDLSGCGGGIPDLLITRAHRAYLIEIKNRAGRNRFTDAQVKYYTQVQCLVYVLRDIDDVEKFVNGQIMAVNGHHELQDLKDLKPTT